MILAGDIGGTKTILALYEQQQDNITPLCQKTYVTQDYPSLNEVLDEFLNNQVISAACFGIAGPITTTMTDQYCKLTNVNWMISCAQITSRFAIKKLLLINDFIAISYAVKTLTERELYPLQRGQQEKQAPIAVIGAGTGLGKAFLIWNEKQYMALPSEGGAVDFAPRNTEQIELLIFLRQQYPRISIEHLLSGAGIQRIFQFFQRRIAPSEEILKSLTASNDKANIISQFALAKKDHCAMQTMQMFIEIYAAEIGNFAITGLTTGGIYIAGGIAAKNIALFDNPLFLSILQDKSHLKERLSNIPIYIVINQQSGLMGAANYAIL